MDLMKISAALITRYRELTPGIPTSYPMEHFDPPADQLWAKVFNRPASNDPATMGDNGEDEATGFFQINIHDPIEKGPRALNDKASAFVNLFSAGSRASYQGQEVVIRRAVPSGIGGSEQHAGSVITITVYWRARASR